jgi:NlpC/P60 family putative phage cell wall peptidase
VSRVIDIARTWLGTPYHHQARVRGGGVDCLMLLCEVYEEAGLVPHIEPGPYPMDWHLHRNEERYMAGMEKYCEQVTEPQPGDIVLYRFGRTASHAGIVVEWPREIIHAYRGQGVVESHGERGELAGRLDSFWRVR